MNLNAFKTNFVWTLLGNFAYGASQWGMLIIFAKFTTIEMVGRFSLALAITAPIIMFSNLNLRAALATDTSCRFSIGEYVGLRSLMLMLALCAISIFAIIGGYNDDVKWLIVLVGISKVIESASDLLYGYMQLHDRMDYIARSLIVKSVLSLTFLSIAIYISKNIMWAVIGLVVAWLLLFVLYDLPRSRKLMVSQQIPTHNGSNPGISFRPLLWSKRLGKLAVITLPLGVTTLLHALIANVPRYIIEQNIGERALGIFAAIAYIMIIGARVITALGESAVPRLTRYYASRDIDNIKLLLSKLLAVDIAIGVLGIIIAVLGGRGILILLYQEEYGKYQDVFIWVMIAASVNYVVLLLHYNMIAARYFKMQPVILLIFLCTLTGLCLIFIPTYGIVGAAQALTLNGAIHLVASIYLTKRILMQQNI